MGDGLVESARRLGALRWLELRLFEVLGGWVPDVAEPEVAAHLAVHSHRHAWHAELLAGLLPSTADLDVDSLTRPAAPGIETFVEALRDAGGRARTVEKLAGAYRVALPRTIAAYDAHLATASPVADASAQRWLGFVVRDQVEEWRRGEALLQALLGDAELADRAASHQARLEALIVAAGGVAGPLPAGSGA